MRRNIFQLFAIVLIVLNGQSLFCIDTFEIPKDRLRDPNPEIRMSALEEYRGELPKFASSADGFKFLIEIAQRDPDDSVRYKAMDVVRYFNLNDKPRIYDRELIDNLKGIVLDSKQAEYSRTWALHFLQESDIPDLLPWSYQIFNDESLPIELR